MFLEAAGNGIPEWIQQVGGLGVTTGLLAWFLRSSLTTLETRLAQIVEKIDASSLAARNEVSEVEKQHRAEVDALSKSFKETVDTLVSENRKTCESLLARSDALTERLEIGRAHV